MQFFKMATASLLFAVLLSCSITTASAQQITGEISGAITDSTGARIPGATVVVTNSDTNEIVRTIQSNREGIYSAPLLQVGTYTVKASFKGFEPKTIDHIEVDVSAALRIDVALVPGHSTETVQVAASNSLAPDFENGAVASVITGHRDQGPSRSIPGILSSLCNYSRAWCTPARATNFIPVA